MADVYKKVGKFKRFLTYTILIAILIGSNVASLYVYSLIDQINDLTIENVELESDVSRLLEENTQVKVGIQELTEPSKSPRLQ